MSPHAVVAPDSIRSISAENRSDAWSANFSRRPWDLVDELVARKVMTAETGLTASRAARRSAIPIEEVLASRRLASETDIACALASISGVQKADLDRYPPDGRLLDAYGADKAIQDCVLPWKRLGRTTVVVASSPSAYKNALPNLLSTFDDPAMAIAPLASITQAVTRLRHSSLARRAETRVRADESCRSLRLPGWPQVGAIVAACLFFLLCAAPVASFNFLLGWAVATLAASTALKACAAIATLTAPDATKSKPGFTALSLPQLPRISILVPLYKETKIAEHLVERLQKLNYPRERLEVILITESDDLTTKDTLAQVQLPNWMRQIVVPPGCVKTKPRALNYALDHCQGTIVGVYDAEDAPDPDQLLTVAAQFATAAPEVVCLQGRLDYYNPHANWLARCFTMEYAAWFRVVLPGLAKLGLPVPLGGTTLFFRRAVLVELGGWDAHNVTEDADLGLRLARKGYRTELCDTVTYEEANHRTWPWIKQRSRWLKGYAVTYAVHMRNPGALLRDLGPRGFLGVQLLFAGTLSQFMLAPLLWSFWLILFGFDHPLGVSLSSDTIILLSAGFLTSEIIGLVVTWLGIMRSKHNHLYVWAPTMHMYFPLGAIAAYKGFYELFGSPFYWDKTAHGVDLMPLKKEPDVAFKTSRERVLSALRENPIPPPRFASGSRRLHLDAA